MSSRDIIRVSSGKWKWTSLHIRSVGSWCVVSDCTCSEVWCMHENCTQILQAVKNCLNVCWRQLWGYNQVMSQPLDKWSMPFMEMLHLSSGRDIHYHDHKKTGSPPNGFPRSLYLKHLATQNLHIYIWASLWIIGLPLVHIFDTYGPGNQSLTWTPGTRVSTLMKYINPKFPPRGGIRVGRLED